MHRLSVRLRFYERSDVLSLVEVSNLSNKALPENLNSVSKKYYFFMKNIVFLLGIFELKHGQPVLSPDNVGLSF